MAEAEETVANSVIEQRAGAWATWRDLERSQRLRIIGLTGSAGLLTLLFVQPLARILDLALQNDLHSYIPLVPVISGYLLYIQPSKDIAYRSSVGAAIRVSAIGIAALAAAIGLESLSVNDDLALMALAYVSFVAAGGFLFLGSEWMGAAAFPVAFLIFMVPLPDAAVNWLEIASVLASADVSALLFRVTGTPLLRDGTVFALPGIVLEGRPGVQWHPLHWVLFITSLVASHLFLKSPWRRIVLVAFVIPLAIVRNGFRILVIGLLCVHVGPHMIDSFIHRRGGPMFFALSLVPLFLFLLWLRRHDKRVNPTPRGSVGDRLLPPSFRGWILQPASGRGQPGSPEALPGDVVLLRRDDGARRRQRLHRPQPARDSARRGGLLADARIHRRSPSSP